MRPILLVEHDPGIHHVVRAMLEGYGQTVIDAYSATQARARLAEATPAAALVDLVLPDESGLDLIALMRARPATQEIPILVICGRCRRGDRDRAHLAGAEAFATLPIDARAILRWLRDRHIGGIAEAADVADGTGGIAGNP